MKKEEINQMDKMKEEEKKRNFVFYLFTRFSFTLFVIPLKTFSQG
jgi:hypothetical protein